MGRTHPDTHRRRLLSQEHSGLVIILPVVICVDTCRIFLYQMSVVLGGLSKWPHMVTEYTDLCPGQDL